MSDANPTKHTKVLVLGAGPAGYTAALYAARAELSPVVIAGPEPGGQLTTTTDVENYPGYPTGIGGPEMMEDFRKQAEKFGTETVYDLANEVDFSKRPFTVKGDSGTYTADAVIIATGASAKYLGLPSEQRLRNKGVTACATCDGAFYRNQDVVVIGGGDTAMEEAQFLTRMCRTVHLVHRRDSFRASKVMQKRTLENEKIVVHWNRQVAEVLGEDGVTGVRLTDTTGGPDEVLEVTGMFLAIGHEPNSKPFAGHLDMDDQGYIKVGKPGSSYTTVDGVFVCGDVADKVYRQAITAAGTGCMAAIDAERWLAEHS
ncbi:MAG: thioredoxin-disulfide reductase [Myxococcota bacterium]